MPKFTTETMNFILNSMKILSTLRSDSTKITDQCVDTIIKQLGFPELINNHVEQRHFLKRLSLKILNLKNFLISFFCFLKYLPSFRKQMKVLNSFNQGKQRVSCSVYAIASNRLCLKNTRLSVKSYLSLLSQDFLKGDLHPKMRSFFDPSAKIIIHDPCAPSKFWDIKEKCWAEEILIFDANFIFYCTICLLIQGEWLSLLKHLFFINTPCKYNLKNSLYILFVETFKSMFKPFENIKSVFVTSNSYLTELLRIYLLQEKKCEDVCEVMHGVPTIFYEQYIANLINTGTAFCTEQKHSSISQLPSLPMFGKLTTDVKYPPSVAINCYLNQYLIDVYANYNNFEKYLNTELNKHLIHKFKENKTFIVSYIGSVYPDRAAYRPSFFESNYFKVELEVIKHLHKILSLHFQDNYIIIYTPHPSHDINTFYDYPVFNNHNIALFRNTILTWFIADVSFSILSSAVFESSYFGVSGFMLSNIKDEVYPKILLDTLASYNDLDLNNESCIYNKLAEFISAQQHREHEDVCEKISHRIKRFCHTMEIDNVEDVWEKEPMLLAT